MSRSELIHNRLIECIHNGEVEKKEIISILQDVSSYAGLRNSPDYAKELKISIPAARKREDIIEIAGKKFHVKFD